MKKLFSLFALFLILNSKGEAQFLHIGIGAGGSKFALKANDSLDIEFYFQNLANETLRLTNFKPESDFKWNGSIYGNFLAKQNYMIRFDLQAFYTISKINYKNSVDAITYISAFNEENTGYESMSFKYWFLANSVDFGYMFLPTKLIRPYVYVGLGTLALLSIKPNEIYQAGREMRNLFITSEVWSFSSFSWKANVGIGFRYHSLSVEAYVCSNISSIDKLDSPLYQSYLMYGFTTRLDVFTFNLTSKNTKLKVKQLMQFN